MSCGFSRETTQLRLTRSFFELLAVPGPVPLEPCRPGPTEWLAELIELKSLARRLVFDVRAFDKERRPGFSRLLHCPGRRGVSARLGGCWFCVRHLVNSLMERNGGGASPCRHTRHERHGEIGRVDRDRRGLSGMQFTQKT